MRPKLFLHCSRSSSEYTRSGRKDDATAAFIIKVDNCARNENTGIKVLIKIALYALKHNYFDLRQEFIEQRFNRNT